jgi:FkbM family methyltransferase
MRREGSHSLVSWKEDKTGVRSFFQLDRPSHFSAFYQVVLMDSYGALRLAPGEVVLDAGANIGVFTVLAARSVGPEGFVMAVEPHTANATRLIENCRLNNLSNVAVIQQALWSASGHRLTFKGEGCLGKLVPPKEDAKIGRKTVETMSADDLLDRFGLSKIDKVKMDVEGAELEVLEASHDLYAATDMVLEIHSEESVQRIVDLLSSKGFSLTRLVKGADDFSALLRNSVKHPLLVARVEVANRLRAVRGLLRSASPQFSKEPPSERATLAVFTRKTLPQPERRPRAYGTG